MTEKAGWSITVLEETPGRALKFLAAIARLVQVRLLMAAHGYTEDDHQEGWRLLHRATGYQAPVPQLQIDPRVRAAFAEIDAWDNKFLPIFQAALTRLHAAVAAKLFLGLDPQQGPGSLLVLAKFLERVGELEASADKADQAALATLVRRGFTTAERRRLAGLLDVARGGEEPAAETTPAVDPQERLRKLEDLKLWFDDWSTTAREAVKRRDHRIALGLASRRERSAEGNDGAES